ncbi:unnamed protein product [Rotaria sp. Silwood2]|nr:unnamed protein product [Rotaria sp. Silwood2]CAF4314723.1 unnamed protein product [Rotaria sp. Silwood2]
MQTTWSSADFSKIKLLGLFEDISNTSESDEISIHSRAMFKAAIFLSHQYNMTIDGQFFGWQIMQTSGDVMDCFSSVCSAVSTGSIVGIVGPELSREVLVIAPFANRIGIPVISYAATDPELADRKIYPAFYRTVPSDDTAALSIAQLFIKFNWTSCIIIYQNDAFGFGAVKAITQAFNRYGLKVRRSIIFDIATLEIQGNLQTYLTSCSSRIVILWAHPKYVSLILQSALDSDVLGPLFTWILSSSISLDTFNQKFHEKLIGMFTIQPTLGAFLGKPINKTLLNAAYQIWQQYEPGSFPGSTNVNDYALFAFDATWLLIQSLQQLCSTNTNNVSSCISIVNSSFCFDSHFINSNSFFNRIIDTKFLGVSGPLQFSANVTNRINDSYYVVQSIQYSSNTVDYVSVLEWSDDTSWIDVQPSNMIVWPGNSVVPPSGLARLANVSLRIGVIESIPFTTISNVIDEHGQNQTTLIGYVPDLINLLQNRMGFVSQIILAPSNQTYAGLVDAVANGVYDIVVGDVTITAARSEIVEFSNSIFDNSLRLIVRTNQMSNVYVLAYLRPFSTNLWIMLLAASFFAGLFMRLLEHSENLELQHRSFLSSVAMSWWYSIGTIMGYGADFRVATAAGRLLTVGLYLLSLVLVASYTANLASDLTIGKSQNIISGIDDIKKGKIPYNRIGIAVGTAMEDYYVKEISEGNMNFHALNNAQDIYRSLLLGTIDVSIMDSGVLEYMTNNIYCNLTLVPGDFCSSAFGIVIPKNWLYDQDLNVNILSLRESGDLDNLKAKWFQTRNCPDTFDTSKSMTIEQMSGLFLTFALICVLSVLLFVWTNRYNIKHYLFKPASCNSPLDNQGVSKVRHTSEALICSQHY